MKRLIIPLILALGGCSSLSLTVQTQPTGAQISDASTGQIFGLSPITLTFDDVNMEQYRDDNGCYRVNPVRAEWVSGARSETDVVTMCHGDQPHTLTVQRPQAEGLGKDMEFAVQVEQLAAQQRQAGAQELSAGAQIWNAWSNSQQATPNCSSKMVGDTLKTTCW